MTVFPDKYVRGWDGVSEDVDVYASCSEDAFLDEYGTDAHFAPYFVLGEDSLPRLKTENISNDLIRAGLRYGLLVVDVDDPAAHKGGVEASEEWQYEQHMMRESLPDALKTGFGWYMSRGGWRGIWLLKDALTVEQYLVCLASVRAELAKVGIKADELKDWTRLYRLPFVKRDNKHERRPANLMFEGLLDASVLDTSKGTGGVFSRAKQALTRRSTFELPDTIDQNRNSTLLSYAGQLNRKGLGQDEILALVLTANESRCKPPLDESEVLQLVGKACKYDNTPAAAGDGGTRAIGDARRVSNYKTVVYENGEGEEKVKRLYLSPDKIVADLHAATGGWPKVVGDQLFVPRAAGRRVETKEALSNKMGDLYRVLDKSQDFSAWLGMATKCEWTTSAVFLEDDNESPPVSPVTKADLMLPCTFYSERFEGAEVLPHWPMRQNTFYHIKPTDLEPSDGSALRDFLDMLNYDSDIDRSILEASLMTMMWGGPPGARPGILIQSAYGVGSGKTATANAIADVFGGAFSLSADTPWEGNIKRLLSGNAALKRVILLDNLKGLLNNADIEAAITSPILNGHRMYVGDAQRVNTMTWIITANTPSVSRDLADRCLVVHIGSPKRGSNFQTVVDKFLAARREALLSDIIARLNEQDRTTFDEHSPFLRYCEWQRAVLSKFDNAEDIVRTIIERQEVADADMEEAQLISSLITTALSDRGHAETDNVRFDPAILMPKFEELFGVKNVRALGRVLQTKMAFKPLQPLEKKRGASGMQYVWWGGRKDGPVVNLNSLAQNRTGQLFAVKGGRP
jgi:hypothetical protein